MMKKLLLAILAAVLALSASAQSVRTNYRSNNITHISTEYESLALAGNEAQVRVELAGFADGSTVYLLYLNFLQKTATVVPKGVKMALTLPNGKMIRLDQIGEDSATKRRLDNGLFVNRLKYAVEPADMEALVKGIKSIEIITGWNPDDYIQAHFSSDELAALLKRHCEAILKASERTVELTAALASYTDNTNNTLSSAEPMVARGDNFDYNILLSHLYYKNTNEEDFDLAFVLGAQNKYHFATDARVHFVLGDDSTIDLLQTRDDENFIYVYPDLEDLQRMVSEGIKSLSMDYEGGILTDTFTPSATDFAQVVNQQLQLLLSLSPR